MSARPWFPFYASDWQADIALKMTPLSAQGLWIGMLCIMHSADPRGHLTFGGEAIITDRLAKLVGCDLGETQQGLDDLERAGVFGRTASGVIVSRRMIRDTLKSAQQAARVNKRWSTPSVENIDQIEPGNTNGNTENDTGSIPHGYGIYSSLDSDSLESGVEAESSGVIGKTKALSPSKPLTKSPLQSIVDAIWAAAPPTSRGSRSSRQLVTTALAAAVKAGHDPTAILAGFRAWTASDDATREDGKYAMGAHRVIKDGFWESFADSATPVIDPADFSDADWSKRLNHHVAGRWLSEWGPAPGEPGCLVPRRLLIAAAA